MKFNKKANEKLEQKRYSPTFRLVFSSFMFVLMIITNLISNFFPISFLNINISCLFLFYTFYISGFGYGLLITIINFCLTPFLSFGWGLTPVFLLGQFVLNLSNLIFIVIMKLFLFKKTNEEIKKRTFIFYSFFSILMTSIIMTSLNILFFTPLFFNVIDPASFPNINFLDFAIQYLEKNNIRYFFFNIPNYYLGVISLIFPFNIFQYTIISFFLLSFLKIPKNINIF